ncbi:EAL domain-containing protein [Acidocella sp.]|uniref:EAL domain-containing protein n=1 Tax=Acidocella sp. TaxID=50710 RepID=UPI002624EDEB|nr:EAL domain-containing protein [Acidocella sp.]
MSEPASLLAAMLRMRYQPIVRLADGALSHVEVLTRLQGQDGSLAGPANLVVAMEDPELALGLTGAIMQQALWEYRRRGLCAHKLPLAFNLPLNVMVSPGILNQIEALREAHRLPAGLLRFELTETQPVKDIDLAKASIMALRKAGYWVALDDVVPATPFLMALMSAAVGAVKLDRSVVVDASPDAAAFIRKIAGLAAQRQQDIVAEGIEAAAQIKQMLAHGVTHGQGFFFSKPLTMEELVAGLGAAPIMPPG